MVRFELILPVYIFQFYSYYHVEKRTQWEKVGNGDQSGDNLAIQVRDNGDLGNGRSTKKGLALEYIVMQMDLQWNVREKRNQG